MKKNLEIDVPKSAETEVSRQRELKKSIFIRTRIAACCLLLVVSFSIAGTLAYQYSTTNQTPNRFVNETGDVKLQIVENGEVRTDTWETTDGIDNKKVAIKADDSEYRRDSVLKVSFLPEVESSEVDSSSKSIGNVVFSQVWGEVKTETVTTDGVQTTKSYIETDIVRLYLVDDWQTNWTYKNGEFYYKKVLEDKQTTQLLLSGVVLQSGVSAQDYGDIKVNVLADAVQATPADVPAMWGCTVSSDGVVSVS